MSGSDGIRQVRLVAHFPGVNNTTVWSDPRSRSQIDFSSFEELARTAERGRFDYFFLAEGLRLREHQGRIHDLDVVGRPDTLTVLAALSAVTANLGLAGTLSTTYNEPYELSRQLATLDHLSGGRAAWNAVTSSDAFTGENFRRGGYLDHTDRYERAASFVRAVRAFWDAAGTGRAAVHRDRFFDIEAVPTLPRSPQGRPVVIQAGDSPQGRDFAAAGADVVFSRHGGFEAGRAFYDDVHRRLAAHGRGDDELLILPGVTYVLGDTPAEAEERARAIRYQQVSGATAIRFVEQVWGRDLSEYDPEGPLPDVEPDLERVLTQGTAAARSTDRAALVERWRARAASEKLGIRDLVVEESARQTFVGTPEAVAGEIVRHVAERASDGFVLVPHLTPGGLDDFVDRVVPLLQERGALRADYTPGATLRENLGLAPRP
ncbi:LLM class flavin-dependent oxidoreductase [Nocardiopsis flavescens]|uniref:Flavin-dependent oxidoreductase, luciferase family (Includes alkanesulfonate monooxygenase SsuD and methylene tetrahydromethanopterin reductase) n=1 Tax=Nocardiopsis flavescens TaxID=758803 RepID=A0A1M6HIL9_9ACTN|nr:LLM class flavin-dependent oxidoreductase [Nocardiopsis flavescens]SHJ22033.1 Flavin-dependent oxidoreductase, luciferase family (includes alkanesulfonate monooxygenase SsuD and methylene tetrahydromethanopterin reductase) [Nocardiopsis flavescens]